MTTDSISISYTGQNFIETVQNGAYRYLGLCVSQVAQPTLWSQLENLTRSLYYQSVSQKGGENVLATNVVSDRMRWNGDEEDLRESEAGDENDEWRWKWDGMKVSESDEDAGDENDKWR